jgi:hypothetical protein
MKSPSLFLLQIFGCEKGRDDWMLQNNSDVLVLTEQIFVS